MNSNAHCEKLALLSLAPTEFPSSVYVLASFYFEPFAPTETTSVVYRVTMKGDQFYGEIVYQVSDWLTKISCSPSGRIALCGMSDRIYIFDGRTWESRPSLALDGALALMWTEGARLVVFGRKGEIIEHHATGELVCREPDGIQLNAVAWSTNTALVVGDKGTLLEYRDGNTRKIALPTGANLLDIFISATQSIYICGGNGAAIIGCANNWKSLHAPSVNFSATAVFDSNALLAGGAAGVFRVSGDTVEKVNDLVLRHFLRVEDKLVAIGDELFAWFDGKNWFGGLFFGQEY